MRRLLALAAAFALLPAASAAASPSACQSSHVTPTAESVRQVEQTVLCLVNAERTQRGLRRLAQDDRLDTAAARHSTDMVRRDFFSHDAPNGSSPTERIRNAGYLKGARGWSTGENIAWGTGSLATPQSIVRGWMRSAGHKRNILHRSFDAIGVGVALGAPSQGDAGATYTTTFGSRS